MGQDVFEVFYQSIITAIEQEKENQKKAKKEKKIGTGTENEKEVETKDEVEIKKADAAADQAQEKTNRSDHEEQDKNDDLSSQADQPPHQGSLLLDATVAEQAIRYPTDLSLLNEARQFSELIIDHLYPHTELKKKPRTYRKKARKQYLQIAKQSNSSYNFYAAISNI